MQTSKSSHYPIKHFLLPHRLSCFAVCLAPKQHRTCARLYDADFQWKRRMLFSGEFPVRQLHRTMTRVNSQRKNTEYQQSPPSCKKCIHWKAINLHKLERAMLSFSLLNSQHTTEPEPKHRAKAEEEKHFMLFSLCFASFRSQRVLLELRIDEKRRKKS